MSIISTFILAITGPFFRIKNITCTHQDGQNCQDVVVAELNTHRNRTVFTLNTQHIKKKLENADPAHQNVTVTTTLPDNLTVTIEYRPRFAALKSNLFQEYLLLDPGLRVIATTLDQPSVPIILVNYDPSVDIGDVLTDKGLISAIELVKQLEKKYLTYTSLSLVDPFQIKVELHDGLEVIFSTEKDITRQVTSLQLILSKATIEPSPRQVDLRFDRPVLK